MTPAPLRATASRSQLSIPPPSLRELRERGSSCLLAGEGRRTSSGGIRVPKHYSSAEKRSVALAVGVEPVQKPWAGHPASPVGKLERYIERPVRCRTHLQSYK